MKFHKWTEKDDEALIQAIDDCGPLFEHFKNQGKTYSEKDAWNAIAGRLVPDIVVTGAACRRRMSILEEIHPPGEDNAWDKVAEKVIDFECSLAENTFDVAEKILLEIGDIKQQISELKKMWD